MPTKNSKPNNCKRLAFIKVLVSVCMSMVSSIAFGQFGVEYHQSNLPFAGISYEVKERLRPAIRIGTDQYFEDLSVEGIVTYDILNTEDYEFYGGLGVRAQDFTGLVIPIGFNFYPFTVKKFGFQIELASILGESNILRGSWGIRYRFRKSQANSGME